MIILKNIWYEDDIFFHNLFEKEHQNNNTKSDDLLIRELLWVMV